MEVVVTNQYKIFHMRLSLPNDVNWNDLFEGEFDFSRGGVYIGYEAFMNLSCVKCLRFDGETGYVYVYDDKENYAITDKIWTGQELHEQEIYKYELDNNGATEAGKHVEPFKPYTNYLKSILKGSLEKIKGESKNWFEIGSGTVKYLKCVKRLA